MILLTPDTQEDSLKLQKVKMNKIESRQVNVFDIFKFLTYIIIVNMNSSLIICFEIQNFKYYKFYWYMYLNIPKKIIFIFYKCIISYIKL